MVLGGSKGFATRKKRTSVSSSSPSNKYDSESFGGAAAVSDIARDQRNLFSRKQVAEESREDNEA